MDRLDAPVGHRSEPQMQVAGSRMIASVYAAVGRRWGLRRL
jgi:hypothetical protein